MSMPRIPVGAKAEPVHHIGFMVAAYAGGRVRLEATLTGTYPLVWRTLRGLGLSTSDADDAAQQVFLIFARRMDGVPQGKERGFLLKTAILTAANWRRSERRRRAVLEGTMDERTGPHVDPERLLEEKRRIEALDQLLTLLPTDERAVFVLFELEELSTPEIARLLGIPRGTVVSRLRRARDTFFARVAELSLHLPHGVRR